MDTTDRSKRSTTRQRIDALDSQIMAVEEILCDLKRERELEQQVLDVQLNGYTYPVLTLPNEIVSEIFLQSLGPANMRLKSGEPPLVLGHICQTWRDIAVSTPTLWTQIALMPTPRTVDRQLALLEILLTRSRDCPLSLSIIYAGEIQYSMPKFVEAILPHTGRCEEMLLFLSSYDLLSIRGEFPLLRALSIGQRDAGKLPIHSKCHLGMFYDAPKLNSVLIHTGFRLRNFSFRWKQMTCIEIRATFLSSDLATVLGAAVNSTRRTTTPARIHKCNSLTD
ncbi:hypothetical protein C8R43DRAFT_554763 [Mycena crocata]|nr:hypothetical protein C8R43DRAFT_554763 [Mycena crocata]